METVEYLFVDGLLWLGGSFDIACVGICWRLANWKRFPSVKSGVWVARAGTWQPRSLQEAEWVTSHG